MIDLDTLDFGKGGGLITVVTIDDVTGRVLMVAHADREAMEKTVATGEMHYRSRSRGLWRKGETSGNVQRITAIAADCDRDAVIARVIPAGPACHNGTTSCFEPAATGTLSRLDATIEARSSSVDDKSYTRKLLNDSNLRLKKIGEEAAELVHAAATGDKTRAVEETADLLYHALVTLRALGAGLDDVSAALAKRM
jgi:phosphoribosyl-ATP pyrophosphohydrolase/phosphoribosyl-AMP cyclohydrolase